jgi:Sec-independent protein translocase protein TatA
MEILGIGPLELIFILIIALIIMGPKDMAKAGLTIGRFLRKVVTSPAWGTVRRTSKELKYLPNRLMKEAGLEESEIADIQRGLSIPEMDRSIFNPSYKAPPGPKKLPSPDESNLAITPDPGPAEYSAWTGEWDEPAPPAVTDTSEDSLPPAS